MNSRWNEATTGGWCAAVLKSSKTAEAGANIMRRIASCISQPASAWSRQGVPTSLQRTAASGLLIVESTKKSRTKKEDEIEEDGYEELEVGFEVAGGREKQMDESYWELWSVTEWFCGRWYWVFRLRTIYILKWGDLSIHIKGIRLSREFVKDKRQKTTWQ